MRLHSSMGRCLGGGIPNVSEGRLGVGDESRCPFRSDGDHQGDYEG